MMTDVVVLETFRVDSLNPVMSASLLFLGVLLPSTMISYMRIIPLGSRGGAHDIFTALAEPVTLVAVRFTGAEGSGWGGGGKEKGGREWSVCCVVLCVVCCVLWVCCVVLYVVRVVCSVVCVVCSVVCCVCGLQCCVLCVWFAMLCAVGVACNVVCCGCGV